MRSDIKIDYFDEIYLILQRIVERYQRGNQNHKGQTIIYKALHRKLKIEQREPHLNQG
jgi:hypothetical protein